MIPNMYAYEMETIHGQLQISFKDDDFSLPYRMLYQCAYVRHIKLYYRFAR